MSKDIDELRKEVRYRCDYCDAVNNYRITYHRDEEPIYTNSREMPSHYFFKGQWIEVQCTVCGNELTPRDKDYPPLKKHGVYKY